MSTPRHLSINFLTNYKELPRIYQEVEEFLTNQKIQDPILNNILLCVDELVTNIMKYAYPDHKDHTAYLECRIFDSKIEVELRDNGTPFDPTNHTHRPTEASSELIIGGHGIALVLKLMDKMEYKREKDYNIVVATKIV
jgi:serine/threonine-protein kinase RsbW